MNIENKFFIQRHFRILQGQTFKKCRFMDCTFSFALGNTPAILPSFTDCIFAGGQTVSATSIVYRRCTFRQHAWHGLTLTAGQWHSLTCCKRNDCVATQVAIGGTYTDGAEVIDDPFLVLPFVSIN